MEQLMHHKKEERPWGHFERFTHNEQTTVKLITVHAGEAFSLQTHEHRDEFWQIVRGGGTVQVGEQKKEAARGDSFFIPRHTLHRATGGSDGMTILEIAFGTFDEDDIKRIEDKYGRA
ncbi:MAG TPA: phosphomannose isomerase type II C-terminal cupin domain [Candidatus Paceibacterota bacterium]|nr:phosphomannose isomerase type II C-terminal cupin domain [Candidatus Paceibacterota bacterium]